MGFQNPFADEGTRWAGCILASTLVALIFIAGLAVGYAIWGMR